MLHKPNISNQKIVNCLQEEYGLKIKTVDFLPLGHVTTAAFRITSEDNSQYFLKLKRDFHENSVAVPYFLKNAGINQIIASIETKHRKLWILLDGFKAVLYPLVEGKSGFAVELSEKQWRVFGHALRTLHEAKLSFDLINNLPRESFSPKWREKVRALLTRINREIFTEPTASNLAQFTKSKHKLIYSIVDKAEEYAELLKQKNIDFVLCHSDIHANNILIDTSGKLYILDWDDLLFAPKERDLMFIGGGVGGAWNKKDQEELFYRGYGETEINHIALSYYRHERIVQDIADFSERIFLTTEDNKEREKLFERFTSQFLPNNVVDMATRE